MEKTRYFVDFYEGTRIEISHELLVGDTAHCTVDGETVEGEVRLRWYDADTNRFVFEVEDLR